MERDIKDYLHLYIGSDINMEVTWKSVTTGALDSRIKSVTVFTLYMYGHEPGYDIIMKPILKTLSDMTEEEAEQISHDVLEGFGGFDPDAWPPKEIIAAYSEDGGIWDRFKPEETRWLLSHGFDLFNLIPDGLAIDATTINKATS